MSRSMKALFFLFAFFLATTSFANNPGVSYQGRIFKPDGNPLEGSSVQFRLQVRSPGSENCLLYEEVQTLNMAGSSGVFALTLNDGTGTRLDAATYQVDRIFANRETMTLDTTRCATGTTYTPNSSDGRKLVVYFKDETMAAYEAMPLMNLNYVPQAMYALEAQKVDKFEVSNILRAVDGSGNPATAPALNPTQLLNLNTLLATPAANYVQTTTNGSAALPVVAGNPSSGLAAGQIWYDSGSNVMKYYDGAVKTFGTSGGGVTSVATGTGLTGGPITTTGTINVDVGVTTGKIIQVAASNKLPAIDGSNLTNITATDATKLPLAGGTMTGPLVNNSSSASTALAVTQAGAGYAATFMGGNVGIGTATPTEKLSVSGDIYSLYAIAGSGTARSAITALPIAIGTDQTADLIGVKSRPEASGVNSGRVIGFEAEINQSAVGKNMTTAIGYHVSNPFLVSGTITNTYGLYVDNLNRGTNNWAVYTAGTTPSYFAGNVGVGTTSPTEKLSLYNGDIKIQNGANNDKLVFADLGGTAVFSMIHESTSLISPSRKLHLWHEDSGGMGAGSMMTFLESGNVGVGTTGPSTKLHVLGSSGATIATFADGGATTCTVTPASTGFACSSDERLKKNIETYSDAASLENILQLRTVTYDWRSVDNGRHTGYIAQELEKVAPEFVRTGEDGFKQVNYTGLVPWITGAIKAFYAEFKVLSAEVNSRADRLEANDAAIMQENSAIKQENAELKARLDQQEKELAAIKNKLGL